MNLNHKRLFITATDTGVGKSIFTSLLALSFFKQGKKVAISKPIQTGKDLDTDLLKKLTGNKIPVFNTYTFNLPAAPSIASKYEKKKISIKKIITDIKNLEKNFDIVIVEGIGGLAVPIQENVIASRDVLTGRPYEYYLISDLIKDLNYPAIIVTRPSLGTINHTVLTLEYAKKKKLNILGFVISEFDKKSKNPAIKTADREIERITGFKCLYKVPLLRKDLIVKI